MNIMFIIDTMLTGGAQKVLLSFSDYLSNHQHKVTIVSLKKASKYKINKNIKYLELIPLEQKLTCNIFNILESISSNAKQSDIIVSFGSFFTKYLVYTLGKIYQKPILLCIRSSIKNDILNFPKTTTINYDLLQKISQNSPIMVQSKQIKKDLLKIFKKNGKNIHIIKNPIDKKITHKVPTEINTQDFVVVGRLCKEKNNQIILKAFSLLPVNLQKKVKIHFIGKGELFNNLLLLTKELKISKQIIFHGYKKNPLPFIKKANCLILSSTTEGMPNVILESFSQHTLVLASDIEPVKELIQDNKNGILFKNNDEKNLSKKMKYILTNDLAEYSNNAYDTLRKHSNAKKKFEKLLHKVHTQYTLKNRDKIE